MGEFNASLARVIIKIYGIRTMFYLMFIMALQIIVSQVYSVYLVQKALGRLDLDREREREIVFLFSQWQGLKVYVEQWQCQIDLCFDDMDVLSNATCQFWTHHDSPIHSWAI